MNDVLIATGDSFARISKDGVDWPPENALQGKGAQSIAVDPDNSDFINVGTSVWSPLAKGRP